MHIKSIARILAGLVLAVSVAATTGLGPGTRLAHAAVNPGPCTAVSCYAPTLTLTAASGKLIVSGTHWPVYSLVRIDAYDQSEYGAPFFEVFTWTDNTGSFQYSYYHNYCNFDLQMIIAADLLTNQALSGFTVLGC